MKIFKHLSANSIKLKSFDFLRELSMEAYLIENQNILSLDEDEFEKVRVICDELPLINARKSKDSDGRIDLLVKYPTVETLGIVELKRGEIGLGNIDQLKDYFLEKNQILKSENIKDEIDDMPNINWIGILAGTSISTDLVKAINDGYLIDLGNEEKIPLAALTIKRFRSDDGQIFVITDVYFNSNKSLKDLTKYNFKGKEYSKRKLVLAVIRDFTKKNATITFAELLKKFPNKIQGSYGVFKTKEEALEINSKSGDRFFCEDENIIQLQDCSIAVCSQWGKDNILKFIETSIKLGISIT